MIAPKPIRAALLISPTTEESEGSGIPSRRAKAMSQSGSAVGLLHGHPETWSPSRQQQERLQADEDLQPWGPLSPCAVAVTRTGRSQRAEAAPDPKTSKALLV